MPSQKEKPIIFNSDMIKAILENRKSQTRRIIKPPNKFAKPYRWTFVKPHSGGGWMSTDGTLEGLIEFGKEGFKCPYGQVGDMLWVREKHGFCYGFDGDTDTVCYYADNFVISADLDNKKLLDDGWEDEAWIETYVNEIRPSIHMPRWASRITLEITAVRVERLQEINNLDAYDEGIPEISSFPTKDFSELWNSIHKKEHRWEDNPWVWVISFKRA